MGLSFNEVAFFYWDTWHFRQKIKHGSYFLLGFVTWVKILTLTHPFLSDIYINQTMSYQQLKNSFSDGCISAAGGHLERKMWEEAEQDAGVDDEMLAIFGYKVKASDMAEVAQKVEQLEEVMGSVQQDNLSFLASETVHYNLQISHLWLESMILNSTHKNLLPINLPLSQLIFLKQQT
ncbi:della protein gai1 [Nicotiana attenuata]|uniref:Della protein gai1 n=1 Tax=Nicotiana attenuata TaxID=49451 RepID=A0A1J6JIG2_NICAT|nr:della protein gai1 [Nicotiana attenuata]